MESKLFVRVVVGKARHVFAQPEWWNGALSIPRASDQRTAKWRALAFQTLAKMVERAFQLDSGTCVSAQMDLPGDPAKVAQRALHKRGLHVQQ